MRASFNEKLVRAVAAHQSLLCVGLDPDPQARNLPAQLSWEAHMRCAISLCSSCEFSMPRRHAPWQ